MPWWFKSRQLPRRCAAGHRDFATARKAEQVRSRRWRSTLGTQAMRVPEQLGDLSCVHPVAQDMREPRQARRHRSGGAAPFPTKGHAQRTRAKDTPQRIHQHFFWRSVPQGVGVGGVRGGGSSSILKRQKVIQYFEDTDKGGGGELKQLIKIGTNGKRAIERGRRLGELGDG